MIDLEKEAAKLIAFLKEQPRLSENAEQEGQGLIDRQAEERIHNGATVKEAGSEKIPGRVSEEIESRLSRISPDCPYNDWFRVGCALKHEGCTYEIFREWSAKAPKRFDEDACRRTWDSIGENHDAKVSMGTLHWMAGQSCLPEPPGQETPEETAEQLITPELESAVKTSEMSETSETSPLPEPEGVDEMAEQTASFIDNIFLSGESFELVVNARQNEKGKFIPVRSKENVCRHDATELTPETLTTLKTVAEQATHGVWISLNPVQPADRMKGNAPSDQDVTDFRYVLVEADELSREDQWRKLFGLNLPIKCVTWSGGKSLHAIVKITAGADPALYKERVGKLYRYLEEHHFPADAANKNPSRLTRIPGFFRDGDKQYLFAGESGPCSWDEFEAKILPGAASPSPAESNSGKPDPFMDELIEKFGEPFYPDAQGRPSVINQNFFAGYTIWKCGLVRDHIFWRQYQPETGLWKEIPDAELLKLVSQQMLAYSRSYEVPWLAAKRTNNTCRDIKSFIDAEQVGQANFVRSCRNVIHVRNGMVVIEQDGTISFKPFSPDYYSTNRTEIDYDPEAKCPMFLEKLLAPCKPDEIECLQYFLGQCLLGRNLSQTFLLLTGTAGAGKSQLLDVIVGLVDKANWTDLRLPQMSDRFEMYRLFGKTLATGRDVPSDFLRSKGAHNLKSLVGGDPISAEAKGKNDCYDFKGEINVVITANTTLTVDIDAGNKAWERRMLWINYNCEPVKK